MTRGSGSTERTPLVQPRAPAYVFESSLTRRFQRRVHSFQCCLCVSLIAILGVALLISVSFTLDEANKAEPANVTAESSPGAVGNLTLSYSLVPLLQLSWPRPDNAPGKWVGDDAPSPDAMAEAVSRGSQALAARRELEAAGGGGALDPDTPAARAQQASATAAAVQPLADTAYAVEHATIVLTDRSTATRGRGVGRGPRVRAPWPQPEYCARSAPSPCPPTPRRSYDGTCNNLEHPLRWGAARTPLRRALSPDYADGVSAPRTGKSGAPLPSAREVSVEVHRPSYSRDSAFTVMLAVWGQFLDHDITATAISKGANGSSISCCGATAASGLRPHPECFPVRLAPGDPFYRDYNLTCMEFVRSAPAPTCYFGPREQLNQMTSYIDGSVVYGASAELAARLRAHSGGKLRMLQVGGRELLPQSTDPNDGCNTQVMNSEGKYCFMAGDARANENLHLTTMHLIWARQHNLIASKLQEVNPQWDDEQLFQESRRIIGAQMQHITYTEFLPVILGADVMDYLNLTVENDSYADVYNPTVDPSVANHFAASAFRFAHTLLPGLMHATDADSGGEASVRLHQMLFNPYSLYAAGGAARAVSSALGNTVHAVRAHVTAELSDHLFERTHQMHGILKTEGPCGLDLVSLNIQRGRDHGLPAYPYWREHCGLGRPTSWEHLEIIFDDQSLSRIKTIYSSVDDIDLYTGALSEEPGSRLLGPTLTCLLADQFLRLKIGDRFWYETSESPVAFTADQLVEIRKTSLAGVVCANVAGLSRAQARVMQSVSGANPLLACADILQPDYSRWRT